MYSKYSTCQLSFSRLLAEAEKNSENSNNNCKKRKYKITEKFLREITLEENIEADSDPESSSSVRRAAVSLYPGVKMYQCSECDKNYKFASGLHYHMKHNH